MNEKGLISWQRRIMSSETITRRRNTCLGPSDCPTLYTMLLVHGGGLRWGEENQSSKKGERARHPSLL